MRRLTRKINWVILSVALFFIMLQPTTIFSKSFRISHNDDVNFKYDVALVVFQGQFRIKSSYLNLDKKNPGDSEFTLTLDLLNSSAGFAFATRVMLGKSVLYAEKYPEIIFKSRKINFKDDKFEVLGQLTIKNITRDLQLIANPIGFKLDNFDGKSEIHFHIYGEINRHDFGASAFSGLVGSNIILDSLVTVTPELK